MDDHCQRFIDLMTLATRQAGAVARHLQGQVRVDEKPDETSVEARALTAADLATQDLILECLLSAWPEVAVDAEEDTPLAHEFPREDGRPLIVLDPIDGTYNYSRGSDDYAVMAGLVVDGLYRAAVVHYPTRGQTFWATREAGCWLRDAKSTRQVERPSSPDVFLVSPGVTSQVRQNLEALGWPVEVCRCSAIDGACLALGRARGSLAENRADRRRAIALYLSLCAGGEVRLGSMTWQGEDPETLATSFEPTVCAAPEDFERIWSALGTNPFDSNRK